MERRAWDLHVSWLADLKLDSNVDAGELLGAVTHYVRARRADRVLARQGLVYTSKTANGEMIRPRPEVGISSESWRVYDRIISKFGMSPSDRARLNVDRPTHDMGIDEFPPELSDVDEEAP